MTPERRGARSQPTSGRSSGGQRSPDSTRKKPTASLKARRVRTLAVVVLVALAGVAGIHHFSSHPAAATSRDPKVAAPVHFGVGIATCTFVDTTRTTFNYLTGVSTPGRRLVTEIRYPTTAVGPGAGERTNATPARSHGPFPLVVFAHGFDTTPNTYAALLDTWVRAGMVVAAPIFPDTSTTAVSLQGFKAEADDDNQPKDVAFVLNALDQAEPHGAGCAVVRGLFSPSRLALAGQSDGGETVAALEYESAYRVASVRPLATEVLSGSLLYGTPTSNTEVAGSPLLVVQSETDTCNPPEESTDLYANIPGREKWFLAIRSGDHLPPYTDSAQPADFALVAAVTTRFFELEFAHEQPGSRFLALAGPANAIGSLSTGPAPVLPDLTTDGATCYDT